MYGQFPPLICVLLPKYGPEATPEQPREIPRACTPEEHTRGLQPRAQPTPKIVL